MGREALNSDTPSPTSAPTTDDASAGGVLGLMLIALVLSILYMAVYTRSFPVLDWLLDGIVATKTTFVLFLVSLVVAPIFLLLAGMWI